MFIWLINKDKIYKYKILVRFKTDHCKNHYGNYYSKQFMTYYVWDMGYRYLTNNTYILYNILFNILFNAVINNLIFTLQVKRYIWLETLDMCVKQNSRPDK